MNALDIRMVMNNYSHDVAAVVPGVLLWHRAKERIEPASLA